jgi:hypothetical protein
MQVSFYGLVFVPIQNTFMKGIIVVLLVALFSCSKDKEGGIQPAYLIGNWKTIPNGQPYLRWTFDQSTLYESIVPATDCKTVNPRESIAIRSYSVLKDTLAIEYNLPIQAPGYHYLIKSLTPTRLVLFGASSKQEAIFDKCQ